jgi:hypothetical protein
MEFLIADQGIGYVAEGLLSGLSVRDQRLFMLGLGRLQVSGKSSACENGLAYLRTRSELRSFRAQRVDATKKTQAEFGF